MRFFRIIKNGSPRMSLVQKFKDGDFQNPLHEVVYALPPYVAIQYYYQQFVRGNYAWESYPKKLEGITRSAKIKSVFYLDLGEYVIRSSPKTPDGEKWKFHEKPKGAILPAKVITREENSHGDIRDNNRAESERQGRNDAGNTCGDNDTQHQETVGYSTADTSSSVNGFVPKIRGRILETKLLRVGGQSERATAGYSAQGVFAECSRRPRLKAKGGAK